MAQQNEPDVIRLITIMLDGPTSYHTWSQNMTIFLKGHKLWRYVTGSIPNPVPKPQSKATAAEDASKTVVTVDVYEERLEEWESIQSKTLSWFINTFIPSIHNLLPRLETVEAAWKFLVDCYNCTNDSSLEFYIESKLYQMHQETVQSISDFYSQTSTTWEQLCIADPPLVCSKDIELFVKYRDHRQFMHFMIGLCEDFEPTRASLLTRSPNPFLDAAVKELISEENRCPTSQSSKGIRYEFHRAKGHDISVCRKLQKFMQKQNRASLPQVATVCPSDPSVFTGPSLAPSLTTANIEAVIQQVLSRTSTTLSVTLGIDLLFTNHGVDVQDPWMGQVLVTSLKIGCMFEVHDLKIPSQLVSAATTTVTPSPDLWHARLGHPSLSCLQLLASQGRKHHHILDVVHTLLIFASLPEHFWGEAILTIVYTINRIPSPTTHNKSPFELLYGQTPDYFSLQIFGCACFVSLPPHECTKLQLRARLCCFLGYGVSQKGFHYYDPISHRFDPPVLDLVAPPSPESPVGLELRHSTWQAMNEELDALHKNHTWEMVDLPPGQSIVGYWWVYKIKTKTDGSVE
ncbi:uncharacterized protein LOC136068103 [Quercus suber]|uniref:uncharacterized protein LOC136068103 n=1 Tax=Quercus suber TaxID=58331 RepID=UPI0032DE8D79